MFKFDSGYYKLSSSVVCTFFMYGAAAGVLSMIDDTSMVLTALGQTGHKVASDIV